MNKPIVPVVPGQTMEWLVDRNVISGPIAIEARESYWCDTPRTRALMVALKIRCRSPGPSNWIDFVSTHDRKTGVILDCRVSVVSGQWRRASPLLLEGNLLDLIFTMAQDAIAAGEPKEGQPA